MYGLGTLINTVAIIIGGLLGLLFGKLIPERFQETLRKSCGISVLFIGIAGALEGMMTAHANGSLSSGKAVLIVLCLALGSLVGEILNIEDGFEKFGAWLKKKTGSTRDINFIDGFVSASFTVCIGAMAIMGAIKDALYGDISILVTKSILDFIIVMIMTGSLGKGCIFSAIPVALLQGSVTALSIFIMPIMTSAALLNLSMVGSILIFCVGLNLVWGKQVRVANMLPAIIFAVAAAFLPFQL